MMAEKENTTVLSSERRRREAAVKLGRQQIQYMGMERELDSAHRKIQQLLELSQTLDRRLGEIEKEKQEEEEDPKLEAARRKTVGKLWRLQVRGMERQRRLERMKQETVELLGAVKDYEGLIERGEKKIQTKKKDVKLFEELNEKLLKLEKLETEEKRRTLINELKEEFTEKAQKLEEFISLKHEKLALITLEGDPKLTLTKAKLEEFALEIQENEEEAEALR